MVAHQQKQDKAGGDSERKARDVDNGAAFASPKVSDCGGEIVTKHIVIQNLKFKIQKIADYKWARSHLKF
jgi:hypothetical protein